MTKNIKELLYFYTLKVGLHHTKLTSEWVEDDKLRFDLASLPTLENWKEAAKVLKMREFIFSFF